MPSEIRNKKRVKKKVEKKDPKDVLRRWDLLREEVSKKWDNKLSGIEEIREQRNKWQG